MRKRGNHLFRNFSILLLLVAAGCAGPAVVDRGDPEIARSLDAARSAFDAGLTDRAALLYGRALQRARAMDDAAAIGRNAYDLAACYLLIGAGDRARVLLVEAKAELARCGLPPGEALLLEAKAARFQGHAGEAVGLCVQILNLPDLPGDLAAQVRLLEACLACDAGDAATARAALTRFAACDAGRDSGENDSLQALFCRVEGGICLLEGHPKIAAACFDKAARILRSLGRHGEMALALTRAGGAFLDAGDAGSAGDRLFRAARSFFGQGDRARARDLVGSARAAAVRAGDEALTARVSALRDEIGEEEQTGL